MQGALGLIDGLSRWTARASVVLVGLIGCFILLEVLARYLFNAPTIWTEEISRLLLVWAVYGAAAQILQERRLILVDLVQRKLPPSVLRVQQVAVHLLILTFCLVAVVWGIGIVAESIEKGRASSTMLRTPQWLFELPIPLGFGLLALQALARVLRTATGREPLPDPEGGPAL